MQLVVIIVLHEAAGGTEHILQYSGTEPSGIQTGWISTSKLHSDGGRYRDSEKRRRRGSGNDEGRSGTGGRRRDDDGGRGAGPVRSSSSAAAERNGGGKVSPVGREDDKSAPKAGGGGSGSGSTGVGLESRRRMGLSRTGGVREHLLAAV